MDFEIIYQSRTGNTELLANRILDVMEESFPNSSCEYLGPPRDHTAADLLFVGFWTDKGACSEAVSDYLKELRGKRLFLFGTAGFGGSEDYFNAILSRVKGLLDPSNTLIGSFMCQGKMPLPVRLRYEAMMETDSERAAGLLKNFDEALSHPDDEDLRRLEKAVQKALSPALS